MTAPATERTEVQMEDGSTVSFPGKRQMIKSTSVNPETGSVSVTFLFRNGAVRQAHVHPDLLLEAAAHGYSQKIGDGVAGVKEVDDMVEGVTELINRLAQGEWNVQREGNADSLAGASILLRALVELSGETADTVRAKLSKLTPAQKIALRGTERLKPIIARLEAEKAERAKGPKIDADAVLESMF